MALDIASSTLEEQITLACVVPLAWVAWDIVIHVDVEIECIWRRPKSWVTWLYAVIRYAPLLHEIIIHSLFTLRLSAKMCQLFIAYQFGFMLGLTILVEIVLLIRVFALYSGQSVLTRVLLLLFVADITVCIATLARVIPRQTFTIDCQIETSPKLFVAYWLTALAFETTLFMLTLFKFFYDSYATRNSNSILFIFFRDGTWAFALIFVCMLINTLMYQVAYDARSGAAYVWMCSVLSMTGSHVLLNIREFGVRSGDQLSTVERLTSLVWSSSSVDRNEGHIGEPAAITDDTNA